MLVIMLMFDDKILLLVAAGLKSHPEISVSEGGKPRRRHAFYMKTGIPGIVVTRYAFYMKRFLCYDFTPRCPGMKTFPT